MTTMLGFLSSALALGGPAAPKSVVSAAKVRLIFAVHFIDVLLFLFSFATKINEPFQLSGNTGDFRHRGC
jgi:hypothetical protein